MPKYVRKCATVHFWIMAISCLFIKCRRIFSSLNRFSRNIFYWKKPQKLGLCSLLSGLFIASTLTPATSLGSFVGARYICNKISDLTPTQRSMCQANMNAIVEVNEGTHMALEECQRQFKHERWNCKTQEGVSTSIFGQDEVLGTKEAAYKSAIRAAGVLYAIVTACGKGSLRDCGCDKSKRGYFEGINSTRWGRKLLSRAERATQTWKWGGCSVDMNHGLRYSREFWDARETKRDSRALMNLHNYEAGRKTVAKKLRIQCKCHGVSASCTTNTCWVTLPDFRDVGNTLKKAYTRSRKVNGDSEKHGRIRYQTLMYMRKGAPTKPHKRELVHIDRSPSYCARDISTGTLGTVGRICNKTSTDKNNCTHLCCGRGYKTQEKIRKWACKCKFFWCCRVTCKECHEVTKQYVCL
ncbi:protein Wnt-7b-like [Styela clava]|uniref:protein Wnt-7b-like n=1 Tax=Styela clava TaxID=7725 RepID=UPI00193A329B|nr:protein Wnt-7b-like [Styela clava]